MRDKLKRRKKSQEGGEQPAPLQPAYFSAEQQGSAPEESNHAPGSEARDTPEPLAAVASENSETTAEPAELASTSGQPPLRRPRRRRGRGGRGRRGSGQMGAEAVASLPAQQSAPAVAMLAPLSAPAAPHPPSKGVVILAIGLPGSGKSSWFKRHNINPLSSDMVRALLFDDPTEQRFQELVFSNLRSMLRARLIARRPLNYLDATNLTPHDRHSWVKLAKDFNYEVQAVYFDVPLEVCLERNQRRQRVVSEEVMRKMAQKLKPPAFEEGFSKITVVRVKQKP